MSILAVRVGAETLRFIEFDDITEDYNDIGVGLANPARQIILSNLTDATLFISLNGLDDHLILTAGAIFTNDNNANRTGSGKANLFAQGQIFWVRCDNGAEPTMGSVYLSSFYGAD